jgi:hypothetical protein
MNEKATNEDYELIFDFVKHAMQEAKSYPLTDDGETDISWLDFRDWVAGKYASAICVNLNVVVEEVTQND